MAIMVIDLGVCLALHARFNRCSPDDLCDPWNVLCYYSILPLWSFLLRFVRQILHRGVTLLTIVVTFAPHCQHMKILQALVDVV
jgi:hypothetical protein